MADSTMVNTLATSLSPSSAVPGAFSGTSSADQTGTVTDSNLQPTTTAPGAGSATAPSTSGQSSPPVYSSYSDEASSTDQFPMQHATEQLPSSTLPLATTDYVSSDSQKTDYVTKASSSQKASESVGSDIPSASSAGQSDVPSTDFGHHPSSQPLPLSSSSSSSSSSSVAIQPSQTDSSQAVSDTSVDQGAGDAASSVSTTSSLSDTKPHFTDKPKPSASDYVPSTGDIPTPWTASKTSSTSSVIPLDTMSVKTTSAVPLTPPNIKPVTPSDAQGTSILGGGLSDYIVYVGAPLCGVGILILLIVCILCLKKRKAKSKGSPAKSQVQDLWVNSQPEIPLSNRSPLLEPRVGVGDRHHVGDKDLAAEADSNLRRRKPDKVKDDPVNIAKPHIEDLVALAGRNKGATVDDDEDTEDSDTGNDVTEGSDTGNVVTELHDELKLKHTDEGCTTYEAVFDFDAEQDTHLGLQQGDLVKVMRKEDNGWWRGSVNNRIGWFPSNYVQAAPQDKVETENEVEMHNESHLSSFMARRSVEPSPRNSLPTEEEIEAEPIYCKIQPKEKRKSTPKIPDKVTPPQQLVNRENTPIPIEDGVKFKANYDYDGHFHGELHLNFGDIIVGKEQDRNGWMNGYNETTGDEGWFPAVYVEKLPKEEPLPSDLDTSLTSSVDTDQASVDTDSASLDADPASYKPLEANASPGSGQRDLVGIVHKARHTFDAEKAGDLAFEEGDLITVFQVLENGWWLGSKDKTVGWFPGSYVQMIGRTSPASGQTTPTSSPTNKEPPSPDHAGESTPKKSKLRPVRKAPPPPKVDTPPESKIPSPIGKIPKKGIPVRVGAPQSPASASNTESEPDVTAKNINNNDMKSDFKPEPVRPLHDGLYDLLDLPMDTQVAGSPTDAQDPGKPKIPKRYIKPKLVTVPRSQVTLPDNSGLQDNAVTSPTETPRSRPPAPVRPNPPRIGPRGAKLEAPRSPGHQSQSEDEEAGFFHLKNQVRVNDILRQDSGEGEIDSDPYKGMSSFGSFGSSFGKKETKPGNSNNYFTASPVVPLAEERNSFGAPVNKPMELGSDTHTLNDTSPIVFNNKNSVQDDSFMINTHDMFDGKSDFKHEVNPESVIPVEHEPAKSEMIGDVPVASQQSAEIPVTPISPKKREKPSRLAPPKPLTLSLDNTTDQSASNKPHPQSVDSFGSNTSSPGLSKIPKVQPSGEPVSRLPVLGRKETPVKTEEPRQHQPMSNIEHAGANTVNSVNVPEEIPVNQKHIDEISASPQTKSKDDIVSNNNSFEDPVRPRTDSFDRPPVAPKPKAKGLPKLLPKPKAGQKTSPKENDDNDNELITDKGNSSDSSLPTTPVKKLQSETADRERTKEEDSKISKIPLGSKIAQKSPQQRGRRSGIPASPGMRTKSKDRVENAQTAGKTPDSEVAPVSAWKVSESDSDAPLSPVSNIRSKPESPMGARRVKKGEGSLRNRSNSPHERKGIPVSLKQRSNSPASKLPRSGIPKSKTASPAGTPTSTNGQSSGLVQPKPVNLDQDIHSPKSGPNTRIAATPSPEHLIDDRGHDNMSPKPDRPSKPPQVQKQKSLDGKPKQGKSLLPVIHKNMDAAAAAAHNGVSPSPGSKPKRGIPVAKPPRPPAPRSDSMEKSEGGKRTLYQAVRPHMAQSEEELSFTEGTFVKELSDCDRPGWFVGMLADGTTGLYPANYFKPSPVSPQSEA